VQLSIRAARAVNSLHCWKPVIAHLGLSPKAFLVDEFFNTKLSQFHNALDSNMAFDAQSFSPNIYTAPEF